VSHPEHEPQNPWTGGQPEPGEQPAQPGYGNGQPSTGPAGPGYAYEPNGYAHGPNGYAYEPNGYGGGRAGTPAGPAPYGQQPYGQDPYGQQPYGQVGYGYGPPATGPDGAPTLDQPYYGIGFVGAIKRALAKYARFDGRASRSEYWWWTLATVLAFGVLGGILGASTEAAGSAPPSAIVVLPTIVLVLALLAVIVPSIAVTVRRLHDADLSGWLYLLTFVPYVGGLALLVLTALPSKPAGARFDRAPL
jgi:uncharacterized membrane protein YhaH (DUF805 family)